MALALNQVISNFFALRKLTPYFISSISDYKNNFKINDFADEFLPKTFKSYEVSVRLGRFEWLTKITEGRRRCVVFFIESFLGFLEIYSAISPVNFRFNGFYIIVLTNGEIPEIENIFKLLWKIKIFNVNVMFDDKSGEEILVKTFIPFSINNCSHVKPVVMNKFFNGSFVNEVKFFYPKKMKNLNGCPVRIATSMVNQSYIGFKTSANGSVEIFGRDYDLVKLLSETLNFEINFTYIEENGHMFDNGTAVGSMKELLEGRADIVIGDHWLKANRLKFFDATTSYISGELTFTIPPGEEFSSFDRLVLPLNVLSWASVIACYIIGTIVIFIIKLQSKIIQFFVIGGSNQNPFLSMFISFIGGSQKVLPKSNCARFLLSIFLLYSLIIRTLYQGSFYWFLQTDRHKKEVQSIDEMIEQDYKFYVFDILADIFENYQRIRER